MTFAGDARGPDARRGHAGRGHVALLSRARPRPWFFVEYDMLAGGICGGGTLSMIPGESTIGLGMETPSIDHRSPRIPWLMQLPEAVVY